MFGTDESLIPMEPVNINPQIDRYLIWIRHHHTIGKKKTDVSTDSDFYGGNGSSYELFRQWYLHRSMEDYELLLPDSFREEIEDSMGVAQRIYGLLTNRIKRKPDELKSIVDALKAYVIDFNKNKQVLESDKTLNLLTRSTVIDHKNTNRTKLKHLVNNMTADDVLELWGGVVSFTFKPSMQRTGLIVTEKTVPLKLHLHVIWPKN